jgi:phospholipase C
MAAHPPSSDPRPVGPVLAVVIAVLLTSGGVLVFARETPPPYSSNCSSTATATATQSPIRHLFVIIKENHAFENYFGAYPGVIGAPPNGSFPTEFGSNATVQPYLLSGSSTPDLPHDHASEVIDEDNGKNDLFVAQAAASGAADPSAAVGYYGPSQVPQYYAYAHAYALGDEFFSGYLGPTAPNRDFDLAATTDGETSDAEPPVGSLQAPTVLNQLTSAGISWAYDYTGSRSNITPLEFHDVSANVCEGQAVLPFSSFPGQVATPIAPAVVFLDPSHDPTGSGGLDGFSEHPPDNVTLGADWTTAVVNAIFSSPVGPSSAVLLFYDEAGGFWDPVAPPVVGGSPDGFRIPFLVLSDYTPAGLVVHQGLDPAAVLAFIDWNWRLPPLNSRVATSPGLGAFFAFDEPPRAPLLLATPLNLTTLGSENGSSSDDAAAAGPTSPFAASGWAVRTADGYAGGVVGFVPEVPTAVEDDDCLREQRASNHCRGRFIVRSAWSPRERAGRHHPIRVHCHGADRTP